MPAIATTPEITRAFRLLGVSPDADRATIRAAWKRLVRSYHPDQFRGDTAAANARLAELNAAFDLVSGWSAEDTAAPGPQPAPRERRAAGQHRAAADKRRRAKAAARADAMRRQQASRAAHYACAEAENRKRAAALDRAEALRRVARAAKRPVHPNAPATLFRTALAALQPRAASHNLGYL